MLAHRSPGRIKEDFARRMPDLSYWFSRRDMSSGVRFRDKDASRPDTIATTRRRHKMEAVNVAAGNTLEAFHRTGAYLQGHFKLTSGLHSPEYLQCALVLQHPHLAAQFGEELARELRRLHPETPVDLVAAPAMGGLIIGHEVARALGTPFVFTERDPASRAMLLRRGFHIASGRNVVVIEDVITTGGSLLEVIEIVRAAGANVVVAGSVIDRSGGSADLGVPRVALATMQVQTFSEDACPMCKQGIPVQKPGSRPS